MLPSRICPYCTAQCHTACVLGLLNSQWRQLFQHTNKLCCDAYANVETELLREGFTHWKPAWDLCEVQYIRRCSEVCMMCSSALDLVSTDCWWPKAAFHYFETTVFCLDNWSINCHYKSPISIKESRNCFLNKGRQVLGYVNECSCFKSMKLS